MIKTFRGILADSGQDRIRLSTIKGKVGYKIVKFAVMGPDGSENIESVLKIYKKEQSTIDHNINFTDSNLLAAAVITQSATMQNYPEDTSTSIIFDREIFNQDIYTTLKGADYSASVNYYIELEVVPLDDAGAEYTTLKDIRQKGTP